MSNFRYGDRHPKGQDLPRLHKEVFRRMARRFADVIAESGRMCAFGGERLVEGLALFDRDATNIRGCWEKAAQAFAADPTDRFAADMCRSYGLLAPYPVTLRVPASERQRWNQSAAEACRVLGDARGESIAVNNLGLAVGTGGDVKATVAHFEQSLKLCETGGDDLTKAMVLSNLGGAYASMRQTDAAISVLHQCLEICERLGARHTEAGARSRLGLALLALGDLASAGQHLRNALETSQEIGDRFTEGLTLINLASVHKQIGDFSTAERHCEEALSAVRSIGDRNGENIALLTKGHLRLAAGDLVAAEACYAECVRITQAIGNKLGEAQASIGLSMVANGRRLYEQERCFLVAALRLFEQVNSPHAAALRLRLASSGGGR